MNWTVGNTCSCRCRMCYTRSLCQQVPQANARPRPTPALCKKMQFIDGIPVWGNPEQGAVSQIKMCARTADKVALMADHHKGYAVPIGGVVACHQPFGCWLQYRVRQ